MSQQFKYVIRIFGQDVDGTMKLPYALAMVKGIGYNTAKAIIYKLGLDPNARLGELSDADLKRIESMLSDHSIKGLPSWLYNRRKDYETGLDLHLVTSDLIFYVRNDIEREKRTKSWRGVRHTLGLKVRGQRTRTTGRTGMTVGVTRRKVAQPQQSSQQQKSS
ncbi:MAG: 30S ribosomal protein S13 [Saccharolobus sp.]|jgi:small subunit ribosomal protein S13|uniref:30S ribosomal protein S13 n=1 Tax=Saccharolobus sp. TaxID=2100761 RepID=UPI0028CFC5D6|nr:30S ribosomal protein S13 [Saccharolobus sp.]MDT7861857.1 30S ribosomal protein S13 [Saccharolobus sp.]